jgi:predicted acyltransferase
MNAIAIYMLSELCDITLSALGWRRPLYEAVFVPLADPKTASLWYALAYTALMYAAAWWMHRRGWFWRV